MDPDQIFVRVSVNSSEKFTIEVPKSVNKSEFIQIALLNENAPIFACENPIVECNQGTEIKSEQFNRFVNQLCTSASFFVHINGNQPKGNAIPIITSDVGFFWHYCNL